MKQIHDTLRDEFPGAPPPFQLTKIAMVVKMICWSYLFPEVKW